MAAPYSLSIDEMAPRYLGRGFTAADGLPAVDVDEAQQRLSVRIPASLAYYYRRAGRCAALNALHHQLYAPSELVVEGGYLLFMDENQSVVSWGFPTSECHQNDPTVWQRNNTPPRAWYSEDKPFTGFLISMFDWYLDMGMLRR